MIKDKLVNFVTAVAILIFITFSAIAYFSGTFTNYIYDTLFFIALVLFFYFTYDRWNLNLPIYTLIILSFVLHSAGIFGWYFKSPIGIQWDHITHFVPILAFTMLFFQFAVQFMDRKLTKKTWLVIAFVLLAGMGIGTVIELIEFSGFVVFGFGEGALLWGAGDGIPGQTIEGIPTVEAIEAHGGGWFNTMWDLVWNTLGGLLALLIMIIAHFFIKKPEPNLFDKIEYY